jgi:hypothetical protein
MNQQTREKLKMHNPEFYDATENRVAVAQEHSLTALFRDARAEGNTIGALFGSLSVFLSTLFTLESTQTFQDKFGIPASSWQAIFTMVAFLSLGAFLWNLGVLITRFIRGRFFGEDVIKIRFFSEDKKLNGNKRKDGDK